jgi:cell division protein FtsX
MESPREERVVMRRAPRARSFVVLGIILGVVGVVAASLLFPPDPALGTGLVTGYFLLWGMIVGLVGGLLVWLWADWRSKRRATEVIAQKLGPEDDTPAT